MRAIGDFDHGRDMGKGRVVAVISYLIAVLRVAEPPDRGPGVGRPLGPSRQAAAGLNVSATPFMQ